MCYFNGQKVAREEYIRLKHLEKLVADYKFLNRDVINGFDFGNTAVLKPIPGKEDFDLVEMEWGFIPDPMVWPFIETREQLNKIRKGYVDSRGKYNEGLNFLNAVSEELLKKGKVYRQAALERRCIILSTGYYEWRHIFPPNKRTGLPVKTAVKYPYRTMVKGREYFWMAGIWQSWTDADTGEYVDTCAITTTAGNEITSQIHNSKKRMPTLLSDDLAMEWMFGNLKEERITEIARWQMPWKELEYYNLDKSFLNSHNPLEPKVYPELPPLIIPGMAA